MLFIELIQRTFGLHCSAIINAISAGTHLISPWLTLVPH